MHTQHLGCRRTATFKFWDTWRCDFCPCSCWSCLSYFLDPPCATFLNKHQRICKAMQNDIGGTSPKDRWMYDRYQKVKFCTDIYQDVSIGLDIFFYYPHAYILYSCCLDSAVLTSKHTSYFNHLFLPVLLCVGPYFKIIAMYLTIYMKIFLLVLLQGKP